MNKLEHKLNSTLEAMSRTARSTSITPQRKSYIMKVLDEQYAKLNNRYVKQFRVDYSPVRRGNICYGE